MHSDHNMRNIHQSLLQESTAVPQSAGFLFTSMSIPMYNALGRLLIGFWYYHLVLGSVFFLTCTLNIRVDAFVPFDLDRLPSVIYREKEQIFQRCGGVLRATSRGDEEKTKTSPKAWMVPTGVKFGRLDKLELLSATPLLESTSNSTTTIATEGIGLNFADIFTVLGLYSAANLVRGTGLSSFVPGLEFSGRVLEDPTGVYEKGSRVLGFTRFGAYSEIVKVPNDFLVPLPDSWTFSEGAAFLVQALTAWHGLVEIGGMPDVARNKATDDQERRAFVVIVHSASGGVGLWASELVARRGGIVLGIVGDESKVSVFEERIISKLSPGSRVMIRGKEGDFSQRLAKELQNLYRTTETSADEQPSLTELAKNGRGADMVMESLGGKYFKASFDALNEGGSLVTFGSTTYSSPGRGGINLFRLVWRYLNRPKIDPGDLTARNLRLSGFNLIFLTEQREELRRELSDCIACLSGKTKMDDGMQLSLDSVTPPLIGEIFDFQTQAVDAMEALKSGKTVGKVVLVNKNPRKG